MYTATAPQLYQCCHASSSKVDQSLANTDSLIKTSSIFSLCLYLTYCTKLNISGINEQEKFTYV